MIWFVNFKRKRLFTIACKINKLFVLLLLFALVSTDYLFDQLFELSPLPPQVPVSHYGPAGWDASHCCAEFWVGELLIHLCICVQSKNICLK